MSRRPWFPFWVNDYRNSRRIRALGGSRKALAVKGLLIDIYAEQWEHGPLPDDPDKVAELLKLAPRVVRSLWSLLRPCLESLEVDSECTRCGSERLSEETRRADEVHEKKRKAANSRWSRNAPAYALQCDPQSQSHAQPQITEETREGATAPGAPLRLVDKPASPSKPQHPQRPDAPTPTTAPEKPRRPTRPKGAIPAELLSRATALLAELNCSRSEVLPNSRAFGPSYDNLKGIADRLAAGNTDDDVRHVIAVCAAEVRVRPEAGRWFNATSPFSSRSFAFKLGGSADPQAHRENAATGLADASQRRYAGAPLVAMAPIPVGQGGRLKL